MNTEALQIFNPYPGLRPFQNEEARLFFGREKHVNEIVRKLNTFRFVSVVGNSGSGKSSLVRAGILPALENAGDWMISTMKPGSNPTAALCAGLKKLFNEKLEDASILETTLSKSKLGLVQVLRDAVPAGKKLLLLVDQFEELFRFSGSDLNAMKMNEQFVDLLLGAVGQKDVPLYVMITLRSDFLGDCEHFLGLPEAINDGQFLIPRMNREELEHSISGPAAIAGFKLSPRLVQRVLNDLGSSHDQLPVMQHAMMRTFEVWLNDHDTGRPVDIDHYEQTGCMAMALSRHAEEAFAELNGSRMQNMAEAVFKTLTLKGADNRGVRRPTSVKKLAEICSATPEEIIRVANIFRREDRGFMMPPAQMELNEESVLDISHESLMRIWQRLRNWVEEEAEAAELYQRITNSALLFEKDMAGLWRDPDLQIALDWRERIKPNEVWASQYNPHFDISMRFVEISLQDRNFSHAEKRRNRILLRSLVSVAIVALSGLTIWARSEQSKAVESGERAISEKQEAVKQTRIAENNFKRAESETENAKIQKNEAERQKKLSLISEQEAKLQKLKAEAASVSANDARRRAELDKQIAILQKQISDSLKTVSESSEKNAYRMRILSIAQNMAIKSTLLPPENNISLKSLLALQAYRFNRQYKGRSYDIEIYKALFHSVKNGMPKSQTLNAVHTNAMRSVSFSGEGSKVASAGNEGLLILNDANEISGPGKVFTKQLSILKFLNFDDSDKHIFCANDKRQVLDFEVNQPAKPPTVLAEYADEISDLLYTGKFLFSACLDNQIRSINMETRTPGVSAVLAAKPLCLAYNPTGATLYAGCVDGSVAILETNPLKVTSTFKASDVRITSIHYIPGRNILACGNSSGKIILINLKNMEEPPLIINAHEAGVTRIVVNKKGNKLASSSLDGTIQVYDLLHPEEPPLIINDHDSWVYDIAFDPEGKFLLSAGRDKTVRRFMVDEEAMVDYISREVKRKLTDEEWAHYIGTDIPYMP